MDRRLLWRLGEANNICDICTFGIGCDKYSMSPFIHFFVFETLGVRFASFTDSISITTFDGAMRTDHGPILSRLMDETFGVFEWHTMINLTMMHGTQSRPPFRIWGGTIAIDAGLGRMIIPCRIEGLVPMLLFGGMDRVVHCRCMWI